MSLVIREIVSRKHPATKAEVMSSRMGHTRATKARERAAEQAASAVSRAEESSATPQDDPNMASGVNPQ